MFVSEINSSLPKGERESEISYHNLPFETEDLYMYANGANRMDEWNNRYLITPQSKQSKAATNHKNGNGSMAPCRTRLQLLAEEKPTAKLHQLTICSDSANSLLATDELTKGV
jgi:hypothetical protein